ncbi:MAG: hypothetical protein ACEQSM_04605 [Aliarcobacter sp.]
MRGKLTKLQMIALGAGAGILLLGLVLGFFGLGALGETQTQAQSLADRKLKPEVAAVLSRPGGAGAARKEAVELGKITEDLAKEEEKVVGSWREGLIEASGEGQTWATDPNQWKDKLIAVNDQLRKKAGKKGDNSKVIFSDDFYLGLQEYKQKSPTASQIPSLALHLSVANRLVEILMKAKGAAKEAYPTQCILQGLEGPAVKELEVVKPEAGKAKAGGLDGGGIVRESYRLQMECSPEVFYGFVGRLSQDPWLFVVMDLSLENEQKEFLKRSEVAKKFEGEKSEPAAEGGAPTEGARGSVNPPPAMPLLLVLAGKERLKVVMKIDFMGWKILTPGKLLPPKKAS